MDREEYVERVLSLVERIPRGRVMNYGAIAAVVGSGGPRQVGRVMALYGGSVPWWRVVHADGGLAVCHDGEARAYHLDEGTAFRASGAVDMAAAAWWPEESSGSD
ncbi:MAG TPA: MGMT family protein [Nocardioidaceae bacterium]|nr:MGMT family protein [Nocardioidaceae bacterium]